MRLLVFGAGAVGSVVAARLAEGHEVSLVGREDHVRAIRRNGLRITGRTECRQTRLSAVTSVEELSGPAPEAILITVKAYDTASAVESLRPFWTNSIFVSLQNGLGNEETMAARASRVLGAVINQGAIFTEPGSVYHAGESESVIGPFQGTTLADAQGLAEAFNRVGLTTRAVEDVREPIWRKAILNAAVNPVTALLGKRTGELLGDAPLEAALSQIVRESVTIARGSGIVLDAESILEAIRTVARATRDNKSSMLQDLERGRRTEIDAINGALVDRAREAGVPCPVNQLLTHLIRSAEATAGKEKTAP